MNSLRRLLRKILPLTGLAATALATTSCTTYLGEGGYGPYSTGYNYAPPVSQVYVAPRAYCAPTYYNRSCYAPSYYGSSCYSRPYQSGYASIGYGSIGYGGYGGSIGYGGGYGAGYGGDYGGDYGHGGHGHGYSHCN